MSRISIGPCTWKKAKLFIFFSSSTQKKKKGALVNCEKVTNTEKQIIYLVFWIFFVSLASYKNSKNENKWSSMPEILRKTAHMVLNSLTPSSSMGKLLTTTHGEEVSSPSLLQKVSILLFPHPFSDFIQLVITTPCIITSSNKKKKKGN